MSALPKFDAQEVLSDVLDPKVVFDRYVRERKLNPSVPGAPERSTTIVEPSFDLGTIVVPQSDVRPRAMQLLAEWHGEVVEIADSTFIAQMRGTFGAGVAGTQEQATIPLDDVRDEDKELLEPGAFFRLCIAYETSESGTKRRYSEVVFRRLPAYRREELEAARERSDQLIRGIRLE